MRSGGTPASPWLGKPLPHFQEGFQPPDMGHGHMSACPPHPPDMAAHKQNRGTSGSLFQPGEVSGSDFLFHPLMLPRDPGSQSKATMVSFSISPHPSKAPETWRVSLGGRRNHPRRLPSPLPCQKELRGQGRDCKPEGPTSSSCLRKGTPLASRVAQGVSGPSSSCVWNPAGLCGRCTGVAVPLRVAQD